MFRWAQAFLSAEEQLQVTAEAASQEPPPSDIAPFIDAIQQWPYIEGMSFIATLEGEGGLDAVDAAFRDYPVSTEQIIHPERYPNDVPTPVDVSDLAGELGRGWEDLDVQGVGEMWLDQALKLRLDDGESERATTGWDGGTYRAWSKGERVALVLSTVWDSERDAAEFADAIDRWIGDEVGVVLPPEGRAVRVLFASHRGTLGALETGIG
jgi:hypothetical protein